MCLLYIPDWLREDAEPIRFVTRVADSTMIQRWTSLAVLPDGRTTWWTGAWQPCVESRYLEILVSTQKSDASVSTRAFANEKSQNNCNGIACFVYNGHFEMSRNTSITVVALLANRRPPAKVGTVVLINVTVENPCQCLEVFWSYSYYNRLV